jgi:3-hydroxyacyl-[acyl-carrier-protein] dehydratase
MMDIHEILKLLPHRYPILLVDRVLAIEKGKSIKALKNVTINEPFFVGHFPRRPVMPGVMMLEAMAQTAALLSFASMGVSPDSNQLVMDVELIRSKAGIFKFKGTAHVGDELACEAELMCTMRSFS